MGASEVGTLLKGTVVDASQPNTVPCTHLPLLICPLDLSVELDGLESGPGSAGTPGYPGVVGCGFNHGSGRGIHFDCAHRHVVFIKGVGGQA